MSDARRLRFVPADSFLANQPEEPEWVIRPFCVRGSAVMLYGRQGVGKSSVTAQLIHSLTSGEPFLGFRVYRTGPVIYLQLDMPTGEMRMLVERAKRAGMDPGAKLHLPTPPEGEEAVLFNILSDADQAELSAWCAEIQPIAVIVDTIHDAYESDPRFTDINQQIRTILRRFREAIGGAVFVFLNHSRKQSGMTRKDAEAVAEEDADSFMGGQAWEGVVTSSLQLRHNRKTQKKVLMLRKIRLEKWPETFLELQESDHGFYTHKLDYKQMLMQWPYFMDRDYVEQATAFVKTKADIFREIGLLADVAPENVKQQYYRNKGADYPWRKLLGEGGKGDEE